MAQSLEDTDKELKERRENESNCDFYLMIGRRVGKLSQETQEWMEGEMWELYERAKRRDNGQAGSSQNTENREPAGERNIFSLMQDSVNY